MATERLTFAHTNHQGRVEDAVTAVRDTYNLLSGLESTIEQLLRISTAVRDNSVEQLFHPKLSRLQHGTGSLHDDALSLLMSDKLCIPQSFPARAGQIAIAAANLFHGTADEDGLDFYLDEPFVDTHILQLLHVHQRDLPDAQFFIDRIDLP